ncbi:MAG: hypothetical protein CMJ58_03310 [Planctomycetaceae bacterium]|nr:hypothetical protein [Planctomycetaceae bacterium]
MARQKNWDEQCEAALRKTIDQLMQHPDVAEAMVGQFRASRHTYRPRGLRIFRGGLKRYTEAGAHALFVLLKRQSKGAVRDLRTAIIKAIGC